MIVIDSKRKFLGDAISATVNANSTANIDYKMTTPCALFGAELIQLGANFGDYVKFQVIDKDNILGFGANTILNEWVTKWYVDPTSSRWKVQSEYGATIPADIYIRLIYTNTNALTQVKVALNLFFIAE